VGRLDVYCSLRDLLADERSRALLYAHLGQETFDSPRLERFAPHALTAERLQALQEALLAL
jgi:hypothetical protein